MNSLRSPNIAYRPYRLTSGSTGLVIATRHLCGHVRPSMERLGQVDGVSRLRRDQLKVIPDERTMGAKRWASSWIISAKRSAPTVPAVIATLTSDAW